VYWNNFKNGIRTSKFIDTIHIIGKTAEALQIPLIDLKRKTELKRKFDVVTQSSVNHISQSLPQMSAK
jgi:hypothetical protein